MGWLALLILDMGAMRRPEDEGRHGGINSHVFFVSSTKQFINAELGSQKAIKDYDSFYEKDLFLFIQSFIFAFKLW